ncbi:MAG: DUF11 domain-containing protein [Planctomycetes bacterium]|nr:DUF11 domain-containing protein [Planctomycetota bacterium]
MRTRRLGFAFLMLSAMSLCSCKSSQTANVDPFLDDSGYSQWNSETASAAGRVHLSRRGNNSTNPSVASLNTPRSSTSFPQNRNISSAEIDVVRTVSFETSETSQANSDRPVELTGNSRRESLESLITYTPFEPRIPLTHVGYQETGNGSFSTAHERYQEEYLFDGGDRDLPVHYDDFNRLGLDTEDTVVEYTDHTGKHHVKATNRVAVFAPRFGAVRSISQPSTGVSVEKLAGADETRKSSGLRNRTVPIDHSQRNSLAGIRVRSRVSGVDTEVGQTGIQQRTIATENTNIHEVFGETAFLRSGQFLETEEARISYGIGAALIWSQKLSPVISAVTSAGQEVYTSSLPEEMVGREDQRKTKGDLRIVKLADKKTAHPGDVITFTIRYDNVGQRELHNILIVDNLTPRLEYIDDSAGSDRAGRLVVEDNQEGSLVLKFELSEPLAGGEGGVVTFRTRVR